MQVMHHFQNKLSALLIGILILGSLGSTPIAEAAAPAVVTNVVPSTSNGQVTLTWTNPASVDFTGTMVRYSSSAFPTNTSDGTLVSDVAGAVSGTSTVTLTGLTNGATYYFSLFSHNAIPEYSAAVNARQLVMGAVFTDDFEALTPGNVSGQNGWNIVAGTWNVLDTAGEQTLKSGTENLTFDQYRVLNGGTTKTYSNQMVRTDWRGTTTNAPGQLFLRAQSGTADAAGYVLTVSGGLLRISYKTSTGSSFTSMATGAFTAVANTWYTYEFSVVNNSSGLPVLNAYAWTRGAAKPSTPTVSVTDSFNRFNQGFFSVGKSATTAAEYDNVTFFGMMGNSGNKVFPGDGANTLTWTNSAAASYTGSMVRVSTSAYPTSVTDGSLVDNVSGSPSATSTTTHSGLVNGTQYYYAIFPYDNSGNYGTPLLTSQTPYPELLNDNFNSSTLGTIVAQNGWGKEAGTWEVSDVSGDRVLSAPSSNSYLTNMAVNGSSSSINQILSYRYKTDTTSNAVGYAWLRRQANNDGYLIWHNANAWTISYQSGATFTTLAAGTTTTVNAQEANVWFNVEASVINNGSGFPVLSVYAWKEGNEKPSTPTVTFTDSSRFTNGTFALSRNTGAVAVYYDDVHYAASLPTVSTPGTMTITSPAAEVVAEPDTATLAITDEQGTFYIPYIQTSTTLNVAASMAGIPAGGGVRFVLNEGLATEQTANDTTGPSYTASFSGLAKAEYTLDAYEILADGVTLSSDPDAHDYREHIGIGDIYTVLGDSTSDGTSGDYSATPITNWLEADSGSLSLDHRNFPQSNPSDSLYKESFLTDLNDKISTYTGYPVFFMNEAYIGLGTYQYENQAMRSGWTTRQLSLDANKWLVSLGNGDSQQAHDTATFQADMEELLARLVTSYGASYENIYVPYSFYDSTDPSKDALLSYHPVIDEMRTALGLAGGPNLYETFINHKPAEYEGIHPNATGYERIARLWAIAIMKPTVTPTVSGRQITLTWNNLSAAESTISGYRVNYGTTSDNLNQTMTLGNVTTATISNIPWNSTYYYTVVGFDNDAYSVSYTQTSAIGSASVGSGTSVATVSAVSAATTEAGGSSTFTVSLSSQPAADVTFAVSSSNTAEGTVSPASLTFTSSNWSTPQTVTIVGVDDSIDDGNVSYSIILGAAVSSDNSFNGVDPTDLTLSNTDNEDSGSGFTIVQTQNSSSHETNNSTEDGTSANDPTPALSPAEQAVVDSRLDQLNLSLPQHWSGAYLEQLVQNNNVVEQANTLSSFRGIINKMFTAPTQEIDRGSALEFLLGLSGKDLSSIETPSESTFKDLFQNDAQTPFIEYAAQENLVDGYPNGRFAPNKIMNRAEALKMTLRFFNVEVDTSLKGVDLLNAYELTGNPFQDVDLNAWYAPYLLFMASEGVVSGYEDGTFRPENPISYSELLKIGTLSQALSR